jgi:tRNA threonylcarbamoyladenosine biosynthesis protein TsaB
MNILAIESATEACSVALLANESCIERFQMGTRQHNQLILPMVEEILAEGGFSLGQLDAIAFGRGPGAFTGVRIAAGVVQGLAYGAELSVIPVSTLAALALEAIECSGIKTACACIDARMNEVYWGAYEYQGHKDAVELIDFETVVPAQQVKQPESMEVVGVGSGWATYEDILKQQLVNKVIQVLPDRFPRATFIARLAAVAFVKGEFLSPDLALPVYIRNNVARKSSEVFDSVLTNQV